MLWSVDLILDRVQELLNEGPGDFYNFQTRMMLLNQAQEELIKNTNAFYKEARLDYDPEVGVEFPRDFIKFASNKPYWENTSGTLTPLTVATTYRVEELSSDWRSAEVSETPSHLIEDDLTVYPTPSSPGTLILPYIYRPYYLHEGSDIPLGGNRKYGNYSDAISYWVASRVLIATNPNLSATYQTIYQAEEAKMREEVRDRRSERFIRKTNLGEWI